MSKLAVLSLRNRALIALVTIVAALFGGLALTNLKQELIPSLELPALMVMTTYSGASPEVVENDVSTPIETAIQAVPDLESTTATSTTNASIVQATFAYGSNLATAEQKMQQAIDRISSQLPDDIDPQVLALSLDDLPVIQVAVTGFDDPQAAQADLENIAVPALEDLDGVGAAAIVGGAARRSASQSHPMRRRSSNGASRRRRSPMRCSRMARSSPAVTSPRTARPSRCRRGRRSAPSMRSPPSRSSAPQRR